MTHVGFKSWDQTRQLSSLIWIWAFAGQVFHETCFLKKALVSQTVLDMAKITNMGYCLYNTGLSICFHQCLHYIGSFKNRCKFVHLGEMFFPPTSIGICFNRKELMLPLEQSFASTLLRLVFRRSFMHRKITRSYKCFLSCISSRNIYLT